jgi:hypothetical protein
VWIAKSARRGGKDHIPRIRLSVELHAHQGLDREARKKDSPEAGGSLGVCLSEQPSTLSLTPRKSYNRSRQC